MNKKRSYFIIGLCLSLFLLNFAANVRIRNAAGFSYTVEPDDQFFYEITNSRYSNGSVSDPLNQHPENTSMMKIKVLSSDFIESQGTVRIKTWYLDAGNDFWELVTGSKAFNFQTETISVGSYPTFIDGEVEASTIQDFFTNAPFFIPSGLNEGNWSALRQRVLTTFQNSYTGVIGYTTINDEIELINNTLSGANLGPTNNYYFNVTYNEIGLLTQFYIWVDGINAAGNPIEHNVVNIQLMQYDFDLTYQSESNEQAAEIAIITVMSILAVVFVIYFRKKSI